MAAKKPKNDDSPTPPAPEDSTNEEVLHTGGVHRVVLKRWRWGDNEHALLWNSEDNSLSVVNITEIEADKAAQAEIEGEGNDEGEIGDTGE